MKGLQATEVIPSSAKLQLIGFMGFFLLHWPTDKDVSSVPPVVWLTLIGVLVWRWRDISAWQFMTVMLTAIISAFAAAHALGAKLF